MYADPNGDPRLAKVDEEADGFYAINEEHTAHKEEEFTKKSVSVTITLDGDDEEETDTSKDKPFCNLQFLGEEDSDNNNGADTALLSGDKQTDDTVASMEHVLKVGSQRVSKEPQMTSADLSGKKKAMKRNLLGNIKKKSRVSKMLTVRKTRNEGPATIGGESVEEPDIQILYDSARSVNEVTNVATVHAQKHGEQAIEDNGENDLAQRNPRNVSDTFVALPKGSDVSCISEPGVVDNVGEELLAAEVQEPSLCENTKAAPQLPENKIDSSLNLVIRGTMGPSSTSSTNWDQIASSNPVFLENTVNSVFPTNKEVLKMASEVEKSGDFDPRVNDSSVEQSSALEVSAVAKEDFGPEKDNNNTNKEKDDSGQGLKVSPPKEYYVEIISDYEGDLRQSEESDETVVLDDDYILSDLVVIDDDEDEEVEIVAGKPGRAWRMIEVEKGPSSTKTELFVHYKLSPHDGQPRKPVIPSETNNFTTRILLENNNITNKEKDESGQGLKVSPPKEDYVEIISDYEGDLRQSEESDETVVLDDDDNLSDLVVIDDDEDDGVEIVTGKPGRAWRMIEVKKGHSSTKTELFVHYKLSPHDGQPREPVIPSEMNNFTTRILLEAASVPPPVISNFGAAMFDVPLDRSILNSGTNPLDSLPFLVPELESASTAARNERKRPADQEKSKRRQISERLGVSDELWKPKIYKPVSGLTMEDQLEFNSRAHITDRERNLQAMGVIEEYGVLPRNQFQFPFDPYAGLYWPVFQPFDDIDLNDRQETDAADVRNQLTDLTICNFIAKKELLCDADPGGWAKSFKEADRMTEAEREKNGRFANRVGFARKINNQNIMEARESDQKKQWEHEVRLEELEKMEAEARSARSPGVDDGGDRLKATEAHIRSMRMQDHVRENIIDEYSSVKTRHGNRKISQLPSYWFKVPREQYIPANDRRTFLCEFINHFNKGGVSFLNNLTRGGTELPSADAILYGLQKTVIEANYVHLLSARYQLRLGDMDLIYSKKRQKMLEKKFPIGSKIKIEELREFAKLQHWEQKYWTLIWDSLASAYKNIPPVSLLIDDILKPVDKAFLQLADSGRREEYHRIYRDHKEEYLRRTSTGRRF